MIIALHDVGKPYAFRIGNLSRQHGFTIQVIERIKLQLPLTPCHCNIMIALISQDALGLYFQNRLSIDCVKNIIIAKSNECQLSVHDFLKLMTVLYQVDASSYTKDAGGLPYIEHIFVYNSDVKDYDKANNMLRFSNKFAILYSNVQKALKL